MLPDRGSSRREHGAPRCGFFGLGKTIISRSSTLASGPSFYRHGLISRAPRSAAPRPRWRSGPAARATGGWRRPAIRQARWAGDGQPAGSPRSPLARMWSSLAGPARRWPPLRRLGDGPAAAAGRGQPGRWTRTPAQLRRFQDSSGRGAVRRHV